MPHVLWAPRRLAAEKRAPGSQGSGWMSFGDTAQKALMVNFWPWKQAESSVSYLCHLSISLPLVLRQNNCGKSGKHLGNLMFGTPGTAYTPKPYFLNWERVNTETSQETAEDPTILSLNTDSHSQSLISIISQRDRNDRNCAAPHPLNFRASPWSAPPPPCWNLWWRKPSVWVSWHINEPVTMFGFIQCLRKTREVAGNGQPRHHIALHQGPPADECHCETHWCHLDDRWMIQNDEKHTDDEYDEDHDEHDEHDEHDDRDVAKLISWHQSRWNWRYPVSAVSFSSLPSTPNDHGRSRFSHWSGIYKWIDKDRWINNFKIIWIELIQSQNGSCGINMVAGWIDTETTPGDLASCVHGQAQRSSAGEQWQAGAKTEHLILINSLYNNQSNRNYNDTSAIGNNWLSESIMIIHDLSFQLLAPNPPKCFKQWTVSETPRTSAMDSQWRSAFNWSCLDGLVGISGIGRSKVIWVIWVSCMICCQT